jgi:type IX secretion system PorP/SprF family membrane protein
MEKMIKRIKKNYILFGLFILLSISGFSQQDPMYTLYMNDPILINPAYAGSRGNVSMNGVFRKQWVGMDWQPTTTSVTINSPFRDYKIGVGFSFMNDKIGPMQQTGLYLDYAYHIRFPKNRSLSLGLKAGFTNYDIYLLDLTTTTWDTYVQANDQPPKFRPNVGIGVYYYTDKFYASFSIPLLLKNSLIDKQNTLQIVGREDRTYFMSAGMIVTLVDPIIKLKPTILARAIFGAPPSVEVSATAIFYDKIWFGLLYRFGDATAAHIRLQVNNQLQVGLSYDLTNTDLRPHNKGTWEIMMNYVFTRRGQRILSPRYF